MPLGVHTEEVGAGGVGGGGGAVGSPTEASCGDGRPQVGQGAEMTVGIPGRSGPIAHGPPALGWRQ